jgi:hypothetical protein
LFVDGDLPDFGMNFDVWKYAVPELFGVCLGML